VLLVARGGGGSPLAGLIRPVVCSWSFPLRRGWASGPSLAGSRPRPDRARCNGCCINAWIGPANCWRSARHVRPSPRRCSQNRPGTDCWSVTAPVQGLVRSRSADQTRTV